MKHDRELEEKRLKIELLFEEIHLKSLMQEYDDIVAKKV